jgi:hypothetical protein
MGIVLQKAEMFLGYIIVMIIGIGIGLVCALVVISL